MMIRCEHCASHNVRWFTPRANGYRAAVVLCMACRRLTIVSPRALRTAIETDSLKAA